MYSGPVFLSSFLMSVAIIYAAMPVAVRIGLVDKPGGHKLHEDHVPLVGGLAIFMSVGFAWVLVLTLGLGSMNSIFVAAGGLLFGVGLVDDRIQLSVRFRFAVQIVAALLLVYSQVVLHDVGRLVSDQRFELGVLAVPVTVFAIVGAINALNMIDGVDGLAGLVSLVSLSLLAFVSFVSDNQIQLVISLCTVGSVAGFLVFNMPWGSRDKAQIFMGDAGSTLLGFLLAYLLISLSQGKHQAISPVTALWLFAIPLLDTVGVALRRVWLGKSPFSADRGHIHHLLLDAGFRVRHAVACIASLQLVFGLAGLAGYYLGLPEGAMMAAFLGLGAGYIYLISRPWRIVPRLRALHRRSGLTIQGVRHVYVGNLGRDTALAEIQALLGESVNDYPFEIYRCGSSGADVSTYALIDAGTADKVRLLLRQLRRGLSSMRPVDIPATAVSSTTIRQYIIRNQQNDPRIANRPSRAAIATQGERRRSIPRLIFRSGASDIAPAEFTRSSHKAA